MAFKWQHPEWLWIGPVLFLAVLLISILFNRWRNGVWRTLGLKELGGLLLQEQEVICDSLHATFFWH